MFDESAAPRALSNDAAIGSLVKFKGIVVTSLYRDFLPSSWGTYRATKWDYMTFIGTLGLFTTTGFAINRSRLPALRFTRAG